jgi:hypothetical protein
VGVIVKAESSAPANNGVILIRPTFEQRLRELKDVNINILAPIFINKGNTARYHICILPLMEHQYEQLIPNEVEQLQMKNNNLIINISEINNLIIYDLITRYCIDLFKNHYSLF